MKEEIEKRLANLKKELYTAQGQKTSLESELKSTKVKLADEKKEQDDLLMMKELLEQVTETARESGKKVLSETSTNAVQMVVDNDLEVDMSITKKRGVANADLFVKKTVDGYPLLSDPTDEEGGGMADIVSVAMFMSLGMLVGSDNQTPYFLDEPTKYLSRGNSSNASKFLKDIVDYAGKQTLLVTHDDVIANSGDKMFKVEMDEQGTSHVKEITK